MAACIKFMINCSNCSKNIKDFHLLMGCSYMLRFQHGLMFCKNLRCLQSSAKLSWEEHGILNLAKKKPLLQTHLQPKLIYRSMNEEKKEKSSKDVFLEMIYTRERDKRNQEAMEVSKGEYFTQAWLSSKPDYEAIQKEKNTGIVDRSTTKGDHDSSNALPENTFGTLMRISSASPDYRDPNERIEEMFEDEEDDLDWRKNIPLTKYGRKSRPAEFYNRNIKMFARQGKIKEAIAVFDRWMMIEDRVRPKKTTFITLMIALSKVGYTRKTFQLLRQMKQLGLDPPPLIHTLLFYSCENCPMPEYGLKRANNLYHQLKDAGTGMSLPTVKSAVRAFGKCGDFAKAFQILDEHAYPLDTEIFNALLMACISDRKAGFKRALQVWLLMAQHNVKPVDISYNLLAHCMRDSGIGDPSNFVSDLAINVGRFNQHGSEIEIFDEEKGSNVFLKSTTVHAKQEQLLPVNAKYKECDSKTDDINLSSIGNRPGKTFDSTSSIWSKNSVIDSENAKVNFSDKGNEASVNMDKNFNRCLSEDSISISYQASVDSVSYLTSESNDDLQHSIHPDRFLNVKSNRHDDEESASSLTAIGKQLTIKLSDLNSPSGRLSLLGGLESFLSHMKTNDVHPNAKTFTLLLASLPNSEESEMKLMKLMESFGATPEIDFLNDVMMRRNRRNESHKIKDILQLISKFKLTPNMRTYAALALSCHKEQDGFSLLEDMKTANLEPTEVVMSHFLLASRLNFGYKLRLLRLMEELNIMPNERLIVILEKSIAKAKQKIVQAEKKQGADWYISNHFQLSFRNFLRFYRSWLKRTEVHRPRHPWDGLEETPGVDDKNEKLQQI